MRILDLFAGTGSATKAFEDAGHEVIKVELDEQFTAHERDILKLNAEYLINKYGEFDFIWASPPCTTFSIASVSHYWEYVNNELRPKHIKAIDGVVLVKHALKLIDNLQPKLGWLIENPRGMLRKQKFMQSYPRYTITYCQYGDTRMKPTDLWGMIKNWTPKPMCSPNANCHEKAPRGSRTGTQGKKGVKLRSMLPYDLSKEILGVLNANIHLV